MPLSFLQNIYNETVNDVLLKLWKRESRRVYCSVGAHHHKLVLQKVRTVPESASAMLLHADRLTTQNNLSNAILQ